MCHIYIWIPWLKWPWKFCRNCFHSLKIIRGWQPRSNITIMLCNAKKMVPSWLFHGIFSLLSWSIVWAWHVRHVLWTGEGRFVHMFYFSSKVNYVMWTWFTSNSRQPLKVALLNRSNGRMRSSSLSRRTQKWIWQNLPTRPVFLNWRCSCLSYREKHPSIQRAECISCHRVSILGPTQILSLSQRFNSWHWR